MLPRLKRARQSKSRGQWIPVSSPQIGKEEEKAIARVLRSGNLAQGSEVARFEEEFSEAATGGLYCVAVNSGTSALHLTLLALGIGKGDEVIVPSFTFAATANAVSMTGATPIFADIDSKTFNIDVDHMNGLINAATRAIIPVHLYGHPADMTRIKEFAERRNLSVIEDAAQAHLARVAGKPVGAWGSAAAFSFYPTKNMTTGEGGMVVTSDIDLARRVRLLRNQGQDMKYHNEVIGLNNRMTDIHAAIGRVQLRKLFAWTQLRREKAKIYDRELIGVQIPFRMHDIEHVYHQYTIRVPRGLRDSVATHLQERGIGTGIYYPVPVHRLPAYDSNLELTETEKAVEEVLSLPIHPRLTNEQQDFVIDEINDIMRKSG